MKRLLAGLLALSCILTAQAQLVLSTLNAPHIIDFDNTVDGVNNGAFAGTGFQPTPGVGQLDSDAWAATGFSHATLSFGDVLTSNDFARGLTSSSETTGGVYAFSGGNITTGRALGIQGSDLDWTPGTLTLKLRNDTGVTLTSLTLSYVVYVRNDENYATSFNFSHSADHSTYSAVAALNLTSTEAGNATEGFVAHNRSTTLTGLSLTPSSDHFFRWTGTDVAGFGARDEFGLDNITITPVPEPGAYAAVAAAALLGFAALRRLRLRPSCSCPDPE